MSHGTKAQKTKPSNDNILRTVPDERAFYFYKGIDSPAGIKASNLEEFLQTLKKVDATSVEFHTGRHDFENWIRMLETTNYLSRSWLCEIEVCHQYSCIKN